MESKVEDVKKREETAKSTINNYVLASMATGLIPIPIIDLFALIGIQLKMVHSLADCFNVRFTQGLGKSIIASLLGSVLPVSFAPLIGSLVKLIPLVGSTTSVLSLPVVSGAATYATGKIFLQHFASGGTLLDFDPEKMRDYYTELLKEGKTVASELKDSQSKKEKTVIEH